MAAPNYTASDYLGALLALLPRGRAWPRDADAPQVQALAGLAPSLARVNGRANQLLVDAFPGTTYELLQEWESTLGLPDPCIGTDGSYQQRLSLVTSRFAGQGGQSVSYYTAVAKSVGYDISIQQFHQYTVTDDCSMGLCGADWNHAWSVISAASDGTHVRNVNDDVGTALASWGNPVLECLMTRYKPAHTVVLFAYT